MPEAVGACLLAEEEGKAEPFVRRVLRGYWAEEADITDLDQLAAWGEACGLDREAVRNAALSEAYKQRLDANTREAVPRGVTFAPWVGRGDDGLLAPRVFATPALRESHAYVMVRRGGVDLGLYSIPHAPVRWKASCRAERTAASAERSGSPRTPWIVATWPSADDRERLAEAGYRVARERGPWVVLHRSGEEAPPHRPD